jgi:hypothetical protein
MLPFVNLRLDSRQSMRRSSLPSSGCFCDLATPSKVPQSLLMMVKWIVEHREQGFACRNIWRGYLERRFGGMAVSISLNSPA